MQTFVIKRSKWKNINMSTPSECSDLPEVPKASPPKKTEEEVAKPSLEKVYQHLIITVAKIVQKELSEQPGDSKKPLKFRKRKSLMKKICFDFRTSETQDHRLIANCIRTISEMQAEMCIKQTEDESMDRETLQDLFKGQLWEKLTVNGATGNIRLLEDISKKE